MTNTPYTWAQGEKANIKEPIEILKENGWKAGDVPAASNFNWLFKKMTQDINALNTELSELKKILIQDMAKLNNKAERLKRCTHVLESFANRNVRMGDFNEGICWQINEGVKNLEQQLQAIHPHYQPVNWPLLSNNPPTRRSELSDIFDEIERAEELTEALENEEDKQVLHLL